MKKSANNATVEARGFVEKLFGFSLSSYVCALITFIASFINTRIYDTATMGKINLFFTAQTFVLYFAYFGMDQSYCRYYYENEDEKSKAHLYDICLSVSLYVSLVLIIVILLGWRFTSSYITGDFSVIVAISLAVSVAAQVIWRYLSLKERMQQHIILYTILMVLNSVTNKLSYTSVSWISKDINIITLSIAASSLVVTLIYYAVKHTKSSLLPISLIKKDEIAHRALKFGIPLMPVSLISWLNSSVPTLLLRRLSTYENVGIYSNTVVLVSIISIIQSGFNTFWVPYYYENYKDGQLKIMKVHNVICYVMVAFAIMLIIVKPVIFFILGKDYRLGSVAFAFLLVSPVCYTIGETTGIGIGISEKSYLNSLVYFIGAGATFVISSVLIPNYGIMGAGIAVAISAVLTLTTKTVIGERYYRTVQNKLKTISSICLLAISCIIDAIFSDIMFIRLVLLMGVLVVLSIIYIREINQCIRVGKTFITTRLLR